MKKNGTEAVLLTNGTELISREDLKSIPLPKPTRTHKPIAHLDFVESLIEALSMRSLSITRDEYAVSNDGMKMFGVMDLDTEFSGCRFSIGLRNANDKSMRLGLTAGLRVLVCDNMTFSGDFTTLSQKHSKSLNLSDSFSIAVDRIHRSFEPLKADVHEMKERNLSENHAKLLIYEAFIEGRIRGIPKHLVRVVHKNYFEPEHPEFQTGNLWSLSNAFTSSFKELRPMKQFEITARLGSFMNSVRGNDTGASSSQAGAGFGSLTPKPAGATA
ncbi:MAG: hypothetical protein DWQ47_11955 [Acidobacteria bacterium]|nr:MAG: hypothetical protein DWQ32_14370 [Acidobacteriota bacterium]REJ98285.1 MAG: hypothetical protein DWQ38_17170 [Acidobacteriota bacterium]REK17029.1 MAG: hypothetical protein DWQ43_02215 [Acidobacteriota bacterium]REK42939.1 MAG: hypothetical protein DWQ47_11955 [Acidobacteriota bacterium]